MRHTSKRAAFRAALKGATCIMFMPLPVPDPSDEDFAWDIAFDFDDGDDGDDEPVDLLLPADTPLADQLALDELFDQGFTWEEGLRLLILREHLYDVPEMREHVTGDPHLHFLRWLYHRGIYTS